MNHQRKRIVVGDIHGELEGFHEILRNANLVDNTNNWIGRDTVLIQTGDVIDRGPHSREATDLLRRLQKQAVAAKGAVIRLCGNHELMLLQGDFRYVNFINPTTLAGEIRREITDGTIQASYTDGERLYTHAGLRSDVRKALIDELKDEKPKLNPYKVSLILLSDHINKTFRRLVEKGELEHHPIFHVGSDRGGGDPVGGIFWCDLLSISRSWEAWRISQIFGHTPTRSNKVKSARGLRLIDVDAGMSRVYGGRRLYLEITPAGELIQHSKPDLEWTPIVLGKSSVDRNIGSATA